jgi:hypothetical protein
VERTDTKPEVGKTRKRTPNSKISIRPSKKIGI